MPYECFISTYQAITKQENLPYLVAVDSQTSNILGYANAHGFRGSKGAYRHTVEISLFCHPTHLSKGVGSKLLKSLINALYKPLEHSSLRSYPETEPPPIKQVLAVMAVDENGKRNGLALKEFYEKHGFKLVQLHHISTSFTSLADVL